MSIWNPSDSVTRGAMLTCKLVLVQLASGADTTLIDEAAQRNCFFPTDWSSDGRFLVLTKLVKNLRGELWTYGIETGGLARLPSVDGSASAGALSPDQRWLAYVSDVTGELQVYVRPFGRSGPAVRVSTAGGALPRWRRDGRALFYQAPDGSIMRVPVGVGSTLELGDPEALFRAPRWSPRLFADQIGGVQKTTPYDVSPDGQRFFLRQRIEGTSAAVLLLDWQSLLDRSSGAGGR
jgi:hypothetical protein